MALNIESGNTYLIINNKSGTAMDLSMRPEDNNRTHGWRRHGGKNQQWQVSFSGTGWHFKNVWNGKYLALAPGCNAQNRTQIYVTDKPFLWYIVADTNTVGAGRIAVPGSATEIALANGCVNDGTIIQLWEHHNHGQQIWRFEKPRVT